MNRLIYFIVLIIIFFCCNSASNTIKKDSIIIETELIEDNGFIGTLYKPKNLTDLKPIIVLGGSAGGMSMQNVSKEYALEGFAALDLAYFKYSSLPKKLNNIPLEYFKAPIEWLLSQDFVKSNALAIHGLSRGAELALILATKYNKISVVIAVSASNVAWGGWGGYGDYNAVHNPAWIMNGKPIEYLNVGMDTSEFFAPDNGFMPYIQRALLDEKNVKRSTIQIHKSQAAFMLISGGLDRVWPSVEMSEKLIELLNQNQYPYPYKLIVLKEAGHNIDLKKSWTVDSKILIESDIILSTSDTNNTNRNAQFTAWPLIIDFIKTNIK